MNDKPFQVGETAILCNAEHFPEYEGQECVVTQPLSMYRCCPSDTMQDRQRISYVIRLKCDNMKLNVRPDQLRRRVGPEVKQKEEEAA